VGEVSQVGQGFQITADFKEYISTFAAITSVGPTLWNILFPAEGDTSRSPVTTAYVDNDLIYKPIHSFLNFFMGTSKNLYS